METQPREIAPAVVPAYRRITTWDAEGNPVLAVQPFITEQQIKSIYFIAAAQPFVVDPRPDIEKFKDMSVIEVLIRKQIDSAIRLADVSPGGIEAIMDRLIGRPMSRSENLNLNGSYEDVLKTIAAKAQASPVQEAEEVSVFGDLV